MGSFPDRLIAVIFFQKPTHDLGIHEGGLAEAGKGKIIFNPYFLLLLPLHSLFLSFFLVADGRTGGTKDGLGLLSGYWGTLIGAGRRQGPSGGKSGETIKTRRPTWLDRNFVRTRVVIETKACFLLFLIVYIVLKSRNKMA